MEATESLKDLKQVADLAYEVVVGIGALFMGLVDKDEGSEGGEERNILAFSFFNVRNDTSDAFENPNTITVVLASCEIGGVADAASDGETTLADDNVKKGELGALDLVFFLL